MGLEGWLGSTHVFSVALWAAALAVCAWRVGSPAPRALSVAAAVAAFAAILTGVWLLHRAPSLLTMTHMHVKAAAFVALGMLDHLLMRGGSWGSFAGRGPRAGALAVVVVTLFVAALAGPEAA